MKCCLLYRSLLTRWKQYPQFFVARPVLTCNFVNNAQAQFKGHLKPLKPNNFIRSVSIYDVLEENEQSRQYQSLRDDFDKVGLSCLLVKLLRCSFDQAEDLVIQNQNLLTSLQKSEVLEDRISVLINVGISLCNIQSNFWLVGFDKG